MRRLILVVVLALWAIAIILLRDAPLWERFGGRGVAVIILAAGAVGLVLLVNFLFRRLRDDF